MNYTLPFRKEQNQVWNSYPNNPSYHSIGEKASATIAMEKHFTKQETKRLEDYSSESSSSPNIARTN